MIGMVLGTQYFTVALNLVWSGHYKACTGALAAGPERRKAVCGVEAVFAVDCTEDSTNHTAFYGGPQFNAGSSVIDRS